MYGWYIINHFKQNGKSRNETYFFLEVRANLAWDGFSKTIFQKRQIGKFNTASQNFIPTYFKNGKNESNVILQQACMDGIINHFKPNETYFLLEVRANLGWFLKNHIAFDLHLHSEIY